MDRIVPDCFRMASNGDEIIVRNPKSIRPYQHVLDPLMAYLTIAARQSSQGGLAGNYNIGPDEADCISTGELVDLFCCSWQKYTGEKPVWKSQSDSGSHEAGYLKLDCSRFKKNFAWKPVWHIGRAVDQIVKWYCAYAAGEDMKTVIKTQLEEFARDAENE